MGSYCHRSHFSKRRRDRGAGPNNSEPIAGHNSEPLSGHKPIAFTGNEPEPVTGHQPFAFAGNKPFTKPSAKLQPDRHRQHDDRRRRRFLQSDLALHQCGDASDVDQHRQQSGARP